MKSIKLAIPATAILFGLVVMARAGGIGAPMQGYVVDTAPTPHSADHAVAQLRGTEDMRAPTF